jgi:pterin-4a-carbinolamine dehydratase
VGSTSEREAEVDEDPTIFISYRRSDTKTKVESLARDLTLKFGPDAVFLDTDNIRAGHEWRSEIEAALAAADVLIVAIGEKWLSTTDVHHRRRIDDPDDWVHREIHSALTSGKRIIPIRFDGQHALVREALPEDLKRLADIQSVELRESDWRADFDKLLRRLADFGFTSTTPVIPYPNPVIKAAVASEVEIKEFLRRYPGWQVQYRPDPADPGKRRRGIGATLTFRNFRDAIHFMSTAAWGIDERNHHPEWENIWKSVVVWITQFDIGGDITARNIELAEYLMSVYQPYRKALGPS